MLIVPLLVVDDVNRPSSRNPLTMLIVPPLETPYMFSRKTETSFPVELSY
jgi:hypothetical protein